jgi:hypothetical protein
MYIYKVMAWIDPVNHDYYERIYQTNVEEKQKTYVGKSLRVSKDSIGRISKSAGSRSVHMWVVDEKEINNARKTLKTYLYDQLCEEQKMIETCINALENYNETQTLTYYPY